jgi:hypothetical protein
LDVPVESPPQCLITTAPHVCAGSIHNTATAPSDEDDEDVSYLWFIQGGYIEGSNTGQTITFTAGTGNELTLTVQIDDEGCKSSCSIDIPLSPVLKITKVGSIKENLDNNCNILIDYTITIENIGDFPIKDVHVTDSLLGEYWLEDLMPGSTETVEPHPVYNLSADDIRNGFIQNDVQVEGSDQADFPVCPASTSEDIMIDINQFEEILRSQSSLLSNYENSLDAILENQDVNINIKLEMLRDYENYLRCETIHIDIFETLLEDDWSHLTTIEQVKLLDSLEDLLRRCIRHSIYFDSRLSLIWGKIQGIAPESGHTYPPRIEFLASLEDILKRQKILLDRFQVLEADLDSIVSQETKISFLASNEDLLRLLSNPINGLGNLQIETEWGI